MDTLIADRFEQCKADPCIFRKIVDGLVAYWCLCGWPAGRRVTG